MTVYWQHHESDPLFVGAAALQTASACVWHKLDLLTRARYLRALSILTLQAAKPRKTPGQPFRLLGDLHGSYYADDERNAIGATLGRTLYLWAPQRDATFERSFETIEGRLSVEPEPEGGETGLGPIAIVAIVTVCAGAAAFISSNIAEVIDNKNFLEAKAQTDIALHANAVQVVASHNQKETTVGKSIPYAPQELQVLKNLEQRQREISQERRHRLPTPFDSAKEFVKEAADAAVKTTNDVILPIALVAGAAVLLSR